MGLQKGHVVDLGASYSEFGSNAKGLIEHRGWSHELYDGAPRPDESDVIKMWIDIDFRPQKQCDFLSIDLDGNDYWVLEKLLANGIAPALVLAEINPIWPRHEKRAIKYNKNHVWSNDTYYGMSLGALEALGHKHGYTLIYVHAGINAFLCRNDMLAKHPELLQPIKFAIKFDHKAHAEGREWTCIE